MEVLRKSFKYSSNSDTSANQSHNLSPEDERLGLLLSHTHQENLNFSGAGKPKPNNMSSSSGVSSTPADVVIDINPTKVEKETQLSTPPREDQNQSQAQLSNNEIGLKTSLWRDSSYDFSNDEAMQAIANNGKDFDFGTESPQLSRITEDSFNKASFNENYVSPENVRHRSNANAGPEEVLVCSGNSSFQRKSSLLRTKTKSRLEDPPEQDQRSGRIGMKSGVLGKSSEIDEDDPFLGDDIPEEYKKMNYFSPLTLIQTVSLIVILAGLVCSLAIPKLKKIKTFDLELWRWDLLVLVLICGRLVSGWGIRVVVFFIERNFLLRKRVLYFVYGLRKAVQNCVWLALVLIAWQFIFDKKVERLTRGSILPYVTKILVCLLVGTLIWLVKTLLVKVLASSFHVSSFFDRIQESLFNQYVIKTLSGPPLVEIQMEQEEEETVIAEVQNLQKAGAELPADLKAKVMKSGRITSPRKSPKSPKSPTFSTFSGMLKTKKEEEKSILIDHLHRLNQHNISAWNMKRLMKIVRKGALTTLDERLQDSAAGADESAVEITSENQAKIAAKKIFCNVAMRGSKFIYQADLMRFMREDEAAKTMRLFEGANEGKGISKAALKNWVVNAFRERRALALSLNDTKTAVNKLHQMSNVLVGILIAVVWLLILKLASTHLLIFTSSQLLLVAFMFGNTVKTTFEAIIFLFVMHPFDVGDRVEVEGVQMVVEEMNILTTVFLRYDNQKIIYPNSVLSTKPISNYYRSPDMGDSIDFCIHISTPLEKIALMKERITRCVENKSDHWHPAPMIVMRDVEDMNRLKWSLWLTHTMNHQDMGERWARRASLAEELIKVFKDLDIEYRMLPLDVNVRNMPPSDSTRVPSNWSGFSG